MKSTLSEDDTKAKLVDPKLRKAGWAKDRIRRNVYLTLGKIVNEEGKLERGKFADYILYYSPGFPIAVVEAKDESKSAVVYEAWKKIEIGEWSWVVSVEEIIENDMTARNPNRREEIRYPEPIENLKSIAEKERAINTLYTLLEELRHALGGGNI